MKPKKALKNSMRITKQKLLLVEGQDEVNLLSELLIDLSLDSDIQIVDVGGTTKFQGKLEGLKMRSGFNIVTSIGIIRDADDNPLGAFQSVCTALDHVGLPQPAKPLQSTGNEPKVTVMVVPDENRKGMIETICLESVENDPAMICVEQYFQCLEKQRNILPQNMAKAKVHAFLASREWLEIAHFEYLQKCSKNYMIETPSLSSVAVANVHTFLASRYTPNLRLGEAAKKQQGSDRYWQFDHSAFDNVKQFLQML